MPLFLQPWALLGLAAAPALLTIYLLHRRPRRHDVSALFLWESIGKRPETRGRFRALLPPFLFWLELLLFLLLTAAALEPAWQGEDGRRPLVLVLDDSLSMQARAERSGDRSCDRAAAAVARELRTFRPESVRIIFAGRTPRITGELPPETIAGALRDWDPQSAHADLDQALLLARTRAPEAAVLVLSDQPPRATISDPLILWLAVGQPAPNAGIVNASRGLTISGDTVLLDVTNPAAAPLVTTLTLEPEKGASQRQDLKLAPRELRTVSFTFPASAGRIRASLASDALEADNAALLLPAWRPQLRVQTDLADSALRRAVDQAVAASGIAQLPPGATNGPLLLVTDRVSVAVPPNAWSLRVQLPPTGTGKLLTGPFAIFFENSLCAGLDLEGVLWQADAAAASGNALPLISAGAVPLLSETVLADGTRHYLLNLDPARSTLTRSPAWPTLIWNLLNSAARSVPGISERQVVCGQWIPITLGQPGEKVTLTLPDGTTRELPSAARRRETGFTPEVAGRYRVETASGAWELSALAANPAESDLTVCASGRFGETTDLRLTQRQSLRHAAPWLALAFLALLALHAKLLAPSSRPTA